MSQRELLLVVAHAHNCSPCRDRLLRQPTAIFHGRSLTPEEQGLLARLRLEDFLTQERLAKATGSDLEQIEEYKDHPVARLRHF